MEELRDTHYRQLVESGTADRVIQSQAYTNMHQNRTPLTEGTVLYPFRRPQWNLSTMQSEPIYLDAGIERSWSLHDVDKTTIGVKYSENYVLHIGRFEPEENGYSTWGYAAGLILDQITADVLERERYIPFRGVETTDLHLIEQQLKEIANFALQNSLDIIDPLTLAEGNGQIVGYEDGDYPSYEN